MNPLLIEPIFALGKTLIDKIFPDKEKQATERAQAELALFQAQQAGDLKQLEADLQLSLGQLEINKIEAASTDWFVCRWRPFVGWGCGFAFIYAAILDPFMRFVSKVGFGYIGEFPIIDTNLTMQILIALLGMGAMRSWEKGRGVTK